MLGDMMRCESSVERSVSVSSLVMINVCVCALTPRLRLWLSCCDSPQIDIRCRPATPGMERKRELVESTAITTITAITDERRETRDKSAHPRRRGPPSPHSKRTAGMCLCPCLVTSGVNADVDVGAHEGSSIPDSICGTQYSICGS